jgi:hypothetical protein
MAGEGPKHVLKMYRTAVFGVATRVIRLRSVMTPQSKLTSWHPIITQCIQAQNDNNLVAPQQSKPTLHDCVMCQILFQHVRRIMGQ